jgi:hypothetical protein
MLLMLQYDNCWNFYCCQFYSHLVKKFFRKWRIWKKLKILYTVGAEFRMLRLPGMPCLNDAALV